MTVSKTAQEEGVFSTASKSVPKSTATLSKRASSVRMLETVYESFGISVDESLMCQYVRCLWMDNALATRAKEAVNLTGVLFNVDMVAVQQVGRQRDVSRSASGVDRKHKIQKVLGGAERTNAATSRGRLLAGREV